MKTASLRTQQYIGRFAPSPTGPLHFGSLVTALASFLDAKSNKGIWLVRMEDIDPPRAQPDAEKSILEALEAHGLEWDMDVLYQSSRNDAYQNAIEQLLAQGQAFYCDCSRQQLKNHPVYPGTCRNLTNNPPANCAVRIKVPDQRIEFYDEIQGRQQTSLAQDVGDFVVFRKDGLFAYQLAVAMDDAHQNITKVLRGHDLLSSTDRQIFLLQHFEANIPDYCHIPVIINQSGQKLSKQNLAPALRHDRTSENLFHALEALGQKPPKELLKQPKHEILNWGIAHWNISQIPRQTSVPLTADLKSST